LNLINPKPLNPGQLGKTNSPFFKPLSVGNCTSAVYQNVIFTFFFTPFWILVVFLNCIAGIWNVTH
jgi:hypothetical protein